MQAKRERCLLAAQLLSLFFILHAVGSDVSILREQRFWFGNLNHNSPPRQLNRQLTSVAFGNGIFVAVGSSQTILISKDGTNWLSRSANITENIISINYSTKTYKWDGDAITLATLNDSFSTSNIPQIPFHFRSVTFGNNLFVIVGDSGAILISQDGNQWQYPCVTYGNGLFMIIGSKILLSSDGTHWGKNWQDASGHGTWGRTHAAAYGNGVFVAAGSIEGIPNPNGTFKILGNGTLESSRDGNVWSPFISDDANISEWNGVAYGNGVFVAVGSTDVTATSYDGTHWSCRNSSPSQLMIGRFGTGRDGKMRFSPFSGYTRYIGTPSTTLESKDGTIWTNRSASPVSGNVGGNDIWRLGKTSDGHFTVSFGDGGVSVFNQSNINFTVLISDDRIHWKLLKPESGNESMASSSIPENSNAEMNLNLNGHSYRLSIRAKKGDVYELQASTDLEHWINLTTVTNTQEIVTFEDQDVKKYPQRFYRLKLLQ